MRPPRDKMPEPDAAAPASDRRDPIRRNVGRPRFWERFELAELTRSEWEALCDGCGKCCLNKLEDEESGEIALTRVACRLFDDASCRCAQYEIRKSFVPECIVLTPSSLAGAAHWLPQTCAYRLLHLGRPLPHWHPLLTGDPDSPHRAGVTARGLTVPEFEVPEEEWEDYIIEEPT